MEWSGKWMAVAGCVLFLGLMVTTPFALDALKDRQEEVPPRRPKIFQRVLGEDVRVARRGVYGVDVLRCGVCRLEKRRSGPLTFGGLNVLVLEDLQVVLPEDIASTPDSQNSETSPREMLERMGVGDSFLRAQGVNWRFSGVRLERFELSRLVATNVVPVMTAASGEAKRDGLRLSGCYIISNQETNWVSRAVLHVKPRMFLEWEDGILYL